MPRRTAARSTRARTALSTCSGAIVALFVAGTLAAPSAAAGGGGGGGKCEGPPVTMEVESSGAGAADLKVTDGVARRVPILEGRDGPGASPEELKRLEREAAKTRLAMYQVYLADYKISRTDLTGEFSSAFYVPAPKAGKTAAVLAIVPSRTRGLRAGDVVTPDDEQRFESVTTFGPLTLQLITADDDGNGFGTVSGKVKILELDSDSICVDVDATITDFDDNVVAALDGVVEVPVVKSKNQSLYFF